MLTDSSCVHVTQAWDAFILIICNCRDYHCHMRGNVIPQVLYIADWQLHRYHYESLIIFVCHIADSHHV